MSVSHKLSLLSALIININIMLGSGIFINTVLLATTAGSLGALSYIIVGILMIPLILVIAELLKIHSGGTFYEFGRTIHPLFGFLSSWGYFTAKLASAALGIHIFVTLIQKIIPATSAYNTLMIDSCIILFFSLLNMLNVRVGRSIHYSFIILKLIPLLFIIIAGLFYFNGAAYSAESFLWQGIPQTIPFVLFAFAGFEASCSLSRSIENPEKNGPRAIFISFTIVLIIMVLYQINFFGLLGMKLGTYPSFREAFPAVSDILFVSPFVKNFCNALTLAGIATSSLGASYGILFSNSWNLFALAEHNHTFLKDKLISLNNNHMPYACIIVETFLTLGYLFFSQGNQIPLQQISALGSTLAYFLSVISFTFLTLFVTQERRLLAALSVVTCCILIGATIRSAYIFGITPYILYSVILLLGVGMYSITAKN